MLIGAVVTLICPAGIGLPSAGHAAFDFFESLLFAQFVALALMAHGLALRFTLTSLST